MVTSSETSRYVLFLARARPVVRLMAATSPGSSWMTTVEESGDRRVPPGGDLTNESSKWL